MDVTRLVLTQPLTPLHDKFYVMISVTFEREGRAPNLYSTQNIDKTLK
jgi:hypothetical protein